MKIYQSNYLTIKFNDDFFFQTWTNLKLTEEIFKNELLEFLKLFLKIRPKKLLWDNRNFNLFIPETLNQWIEKKIMIPQYENGLQKLAFIVASDVMLQQTIIKSVESFKPYVKAHFFLTKEEAIRFLTKSNTESLQSNELISLNIKELKNNNYELKLNIHNKNLEDSIVALSETVRFQKYRNLFQDTYNSLTIKEKIIIRLIWKYGKRNS